MMAGVCPSVCRVPRLNSTTERPRTPKIGWMEARHTVIRETVNLFRGQKVKDQGHQAE